MVGFAWIVCNSYDLYVEFGRRNEKTSIFVNDLGILLLDCGGAGLLFMEFTVCSKICRSDLGILLIREDFRDFGDLGFCLVLSLILVISVALFVLKPSGYFLSLTQKKYHSFSPILDLPSLANNKA